MIDIEGAVAFGRAGHYERKGLYAPEEVFRHLDLDGDIVSQNFTELFVPFDGTIAVNADGHIIVEFDGDPIRMNSARYPLFQRNRTCVRCGVEGIYFAKERAIYLDRRSGRYWPTSHHFHFNLYGRNRNGHEVMMTKDHILPRAHGGKDAHSNYQTMCAPCNGRKRDRMPTETDEEFWARRALEKKVERRRNMMLSQGHYIPHIKVDQA